MAAGTPNLFYAIQTDYEYLYSGGYIYIDPQNTAPHGKICNIFKPEKDILPLQNVLILKILSSLLFGKSRFPTFNV